MVSLTRNPIPTSCPVDGLRTRLIWEFLQTIIMPILMPTLPSGTGGIFNHIPRNMIIVHEEFACSIALDSDGMRRYYELVVTVAF